MIKIPESVSPNTPAIQRKLSWILPSALLVLLLIGDIMHYQGQRNVLTRMAKDESRLTTARMITHIRDLGFYIQDHMELMTTWLVTTSDSELNVFFEAADNNFTMWDGYYQGIVFWEEHSEV